VRRGLPQPAVNGGPRPLRGASPVNGAQPSDRQKPFMHPGGEGLRRFWQSPGRGLWPVSRPSHFRRPQVSRAESLKAAPVRCGDWFAGAIYTRKRQPGCSLTYATQSSTTRPRKAPNESATTLTFPVSWSHRQIVPLEERRNAFPPPSVATGIAASPPTTRGKPTPLRSRLIPPSQYPLWTDRAMTESVCPRNSPNSAGKPKPAARSRSAMSCSVAGGSNRGRSSQSQPGRGNARASSRSRTTVVATDMR
jgi:hypothetical protein